MARLRSNLAALATSPRFDPVLGVVLFVLAEIEAAAAGELGSFGIAVPFFTLTLAWRRRAPLAVALGASGALALLSLGPEIDFPSNAAIAGVCGITYSAGAHLPRRRAIIAMGSLVAAELIDGAAQGHVLSGDFFFTVIIFGVPWAIGRIARRVRAQELRRIAETVAALEDERTRTAELAVAAERLHVARELHDTVAGMLNLVIVQAAVAEQRVRSDREQAREALAIILESGRQASLDLQRMLAVLRPGTAAVTMAPPPVLDRVEDLVALARRSGIDAGLTVSGSCHSLPAGLELSAYRIVQEALTNVAKHAAGARADVRISFLDDAVLVEVRDDGGRTTLAQSGGYGITGMRERAAIFGGEFDAAPEPGGGFAVRARLPLEGVPA